VMHGGTLLFAPNWETPDVTLSSLGIRMTASETHTDLLAE